MEWFDFVDLMKYMVDTYGVPFGYDDETHEGEYPETSADCDSAWFECPECGELILYCDWADELLEKHTDFAPDGIFCPICESPWTEAIYEGSDGYITFKDGPEVVFGDMEED